MCISSTYDVILDGYQGQETHTRAARQEAITPPLFHGGLPLGRNWVNLALGL